MFRARFAAGDSWWFMGSSVVGSTPCAITTLPCGAADALPGHARARATRATIEIRRIDSS